MVIEQVNNIDEARQCDVYLNVLENNQKAMRLYKMLGYENFERKLKLEIK